MSVTEEMKAIIEAEIESVDSIRKTGMAFDDFTGEYSRYLAQATIDKEPLIQTKFPWELMEKYAAYQVMLTEEHGDRILSGRAGSDATTQFKESMVAIKKYRTGLILQGNHIIDETGDKKAIAVMDNLYNGDRDLDIINDIFPLTGLVSLHLDVATTFCPGRVDYTQEHLDKVNRAANEALTLRGISESTDSERSIHVDRLNRLLTLCVLAIAKIKKFAAGAFVEDDEYYTEHYANHVFRERYKNEKREAQMENSITDVEIETPEFAVEA